MSRAAFDRSDGVFSAAFLRAFTSSFATAASLPSPAPTLTPAASVASVHRSEAAVDDPRRAVQAGAPMIAQGDHGGPRRSLSRTGRVACINRMRRGGFCSYGKTTGNRRETDADVLGLTPVGPALRAIALREPPGRLPPPAPPGYT